MIVQLTGEVAEKLDRVVIDCGGVGYGVLVTSSDFSVLTVNQKTKLYIHEHIKEDAHELFGFLHRETKELFEQLLNVKNVGPKVALAVLDTGSADQVRAAIAGGDVKFLQSAKGVGKRAAEQIVVELRDKVGVPVSEAAEDLITRSSANQNDEALQALIALGYNEYDAQTALQNIDSALPVEIRIKHALKGTKG